MSDLRPFVHGEEGTHSACDERISKEGGKAQCCTCVPHKGCGTGKVAAEQPEHLNKGCIGVEYPELCDCGLVTPNPRELESVPPTQARELGSRRAVELILAELGQNLADPTALLGYSHASLQLQALITTEANRLAEERVRAELGLVGQFLLHTTATAPEQRPRIREYLEGRFTAYTKGDEQ